MGGGGTSWMWLLGLLLLDDRSASSTAERILIITDTTIDRDGRVASIDTMAKMMGREGHWQLINGQLAPTLSATVGSTQRWRIVNACTSRVLSLFLEDQRLTQVGVDGSTLPAPREIDRLVLAPGNRGDILIRPTATGSFNLITDPYNRGTPGMGMGRRVCVHETSRPRDPQRHQWPRRRAATDTATGRCTARRPYSGDQTTHLRHGHGWQRDGRYGRRRHSVHHRWTHL